MISGHATLVILTFVGVYAYRDIWPLMTYTLRPQDLDEGWILWAKIAFAGCAGIVVPVIEPFPYIPVDPEV